MKTLIATVLATAVSSTFAFAADMTNDPAQYRNVTQKAAADYKTAIASCKTMSGTEKVSCQDEAKVVQARANLDAVSQYNNNAKARTSARMKLADAEWALAKAKCAGMVSTDKTNCVNNAQSVHMAALADAKADRDVQVAANTDETRHTGNTGIAPPVTSTATANPTKAAAVEKCAQIAGKPDTGCLINNRNAVATTTGTSGTVGTTAATTTATTTAGVAADNMAQKTENAAATAADKTRDAAATVANKTERAVDHMAAKSEVAADKVGDKMEDSVITTKVKADIFKEPELKSMAIHVETEKGVVMLSGFVDSKADAEKAARIAGTVKGVTAVKSALKVK